MHFNSRASIRAQMSLACSVVTTKPFGSRRPLARASTLSHLAGGGRKCSKGGGIPNEWLRSLTVCCRWTSNVCSFGFGASRAAWLSTVFQRAMLSSRNAWKFIAFADVPRMKRARWRWKLSKDVVPRTHRRTGSRTLPFLDVPVTRVQGDTWRIQQARHWSRASLRWGGALWCDCARWRWCDAGILQHDGLLRLLQQPVVVSVPLEYAAAELLHKHAVEWVGFDRHARLHAYLYVSMTGKRAQTPSGS